MKIFLAFIILCSVQLNSFSQKQFQGKVVYSIVANNGRDSSQVELIFGKQAIKLLINDDKKSNGSDKDKWIIIRFDSGYVYDFRGENKTYSIKHLSELPEKTECRAK